MTYLIALLLTVFSSFGTPVQQPDDHETPGIHTLGKDIIIQDEIGG